MRNVSETSLFNSALFYLRRYSATVEQLRRVLRRKAQRVLRKKNDASGVPEEAIEKVLSRLLNAGYLDDERVATSKVSSLRRAGKSTRAIAFKLKSMGVVEDSVTRLSVCSPEEELEAAYALARKKRLGPFRPKDVQLEHRQKDLARLARAGFSFDVARRVIGMPAVAEYPEG